MHERLAPTGDYLPHSFVEVYGFSKLSLRIAGSSIGSPTGRPRLSGWIGNREKKARVNFRSRMSCTEYAPVITDAFCIRIVSPTPLGLPHCKECRRLRCAVKNV